ncbi:Hint domain-containing protein [Roseovarius sp.]|uniref:Hint domain-containing protein n=1 Tax=Roseovarius sp. TaxID=1486281 RepID=UPI003517D0DC
MQTLQVHLAQDFCVVTGANMGDALSFSEELEFDDTYELSHQAKTHALVLDSGQEGHFEIAKGSSLGTPGHRVIVDSCLTFRSAGGGTIEMLVLVEIDGLGDVSGLYARALAPLAPRTDYTLVGIDTDHARAKFAQIACVSFSRGTRITLATGAQTPIENLQVGDRVLTRDDGPRPVRWIGSSTARATGDLAPVRIRKGALNNSDDLVVSPDHRLFIYQRSDALGAGRHEILVRARHLVNGDTITQEDGGFIDYFQLLFDHHQIIYAEGIAAETLLVDTRTRGALPADLADAIENALPDHAQRPHLEFEVAQSLLDHPNMAEILRRASTS